jgi:hypothetical protein
MVPSGALIWPFIKGTNMSTGHSLKEGVSSSDTGQRVKPQQVRPIIVKTRGQKENQERKRS